MRQLSAPGRLAVAIAASLAIAASAGCMSVSDDEGGKPAPRTTTDRPGAVAEPDGGPAAAGGRQAGGGKSEPDKAGQEGGADGEGASPSPSASAKPAAKPTRGGHKPKPPQDPQPTGGGASPSEPPPQLSEPPQPPEVSPTPQPSEPTDPPTASSAPQVHAGAIQGADGLGMYDGQGMYMEPAASPQVGPM